MGLCLTGDTRNESFHIFYGKPRSGKSTVSTTYAYMLGGEKGYAMTVQPETLTQKKFSNSSSANSDIARLKGCRFLVCNELQQDMQLNVPLIKSFTGGDRLTARFLYGEHIEFSPAFKLILVTNHLPYVSDDTLFSSNRVCVIPFDYQIAEIDVDLKNKLKENEVISGAFNWCLKGLRAYKEEGLLAPPDIIKATIQYAQEGDTTEKFIKESLVYSPECNYSLKGIYGAYCDFCHKNNLPCDQKTLFKSKLEAKNMLGHNLTTVDTKRAESNVVRGYKIS